MKIKFRRQLTKLLGYLLIMMAFSPGASADIAAAFPWVSSDKLWWNTGAAIAPATLDSWSHVVQAGEGICTRIQLPTDSAPTGVELRLQVNGSQWATASWSSLAAAHSGTASLPPSDGGWHKLVVDLATGLSIPVGPGDTISGAAWAMFRQDGVARVWWDTCVLGEDEIGPVITFPGGNPHGINTNGAFDGGTLFECNDNKDGDCAGVTTINETLLLAGIAQEGTYPVVYSATDSDGNMTNATLWVIVDDTPPVITVLGKNPDTVKLGETYIAPSPAFTCSNDGVDCSHLVVVDDSAVDTSELGIYQITYTYAYTGNNPVVATRDVIVQHRQRYEAENAATHHAGGWANGVSPMTPVTGENISGGKLLDFPQNSDGELWWTIEMPPEAPSPDSTYELIFGYSCNCANPRTLDLIINEGDPHYEQVANDVSFPPTGSFGASHHATARLEIPPSVTLKPGLNTIKVRGRHGPHMDYLEVAFDDLERHAGDVRTFKNEWDDVHPPVITLLGENPMVVDAAEGYSEPGWICWDDVLGVCTDQVTPEAWLNYPDHQGTVDFSVPGTYTVAYSLADGSGNASAERRTVQVVDFSAFHTGHVTRDRWIHTNWAVSQSEVSDLTGTANYPENPNTTEQITVTDASQDQSWGPCNDHNCGQRIYGYVVAPVTGTYTFYLSADRSGQLWLNRNGTDQSPGQLELIGEVLASESNLYSNLPDSSSVPAKSDAEWTHTTRPGSVSTYHTPSIHLTAGRAYFFEALSKNANGGWQQLRVAWEAVADNPADGDLAFDYIRGEHLAAVASFVDDQAPTINLNADPVTHTEGLPYSEIAVCEDNVPVGCSIEITSSVPAFDPVYPSADTYSLTLTATDSYGNISTATRTVQVLPAGPALTMGAMVHETWSIGSSGRNIQHLTGRADFPDSPVTSGVLDVTASGLQTGPAPAKRGQVVSGYLVPDESGAHKFWIASSDESELWLSTDADPANAVLIAKVRNSGWGWTPQYDWDKYGAQDSALITLSAGQQYYIEVRHVASGSGRRAEVAWREPSGSGNPPEDASWVIPSSNLGSQ